MIKKRTVIKRMLDRTWRPVAVISCITAGAVLISTAVGRYFSMDAGVIYASLVLLMLLALGIKWSYDWHRSAIEHEQRELLRDLEKPRGSRG